MATPGGGVIDFSDDNGGVGGGDGPVTTDTRWCCWRFAPLFELISSALDEDNDEGDADLFTLKSYAFSSANNTKFGYSLFGF